MLGLGNSILSDYKHVFLDDYSIQLDGTDQYINCDAIVGVTEWNTIHEQGGISIWIKIDETTSTGNIIRMQADSSNFISIYYHAGSNETRTAYKGGGSTTVASSDAGIEGDGNWHHVVSTWNTITNKISLYLDGSLAESKPNSGSLPTFTGEISTVDIGQNTSGSADFKGFVNDVAIYNKALSSANASDMYNNGIPKDFISNPTHNDGLIAYYKFETGTGINVTDHTANRLDVTLVNEAAWSTSTP